MPRGGGSYVKRPFELKVVDGKIDLEEPVYKRGILWADANIAATKAISGANGDEKYIGIKLSMENGACEILLETNRDDACSTVVPTDTADVKVLLYKVKITGNGTSCSRLFDYRGGVDVLAYV